MGTQRRKGIRRGPLGRLPIGLAVSVVILLLLSAGAGAAETVIEDVYRLPSGQVVQDDLYISAGEIYVDGTVEGDLVAVGGYIEINGAVEEDLIAAGGAINIVGRVGDDARLAAGAVEVSGTIGDDLFAAVGGGAFPFDAVPLWPGDSRVPPGLRLAPASIVAGDGLLTGGYGHMAGAIVGDLFVAMNTVQVSGAVGGDAEIHAQTLEMADSARVEGTLSYSSAQEVPIPAGVARRIVHEPVVQATQPVGQTLLEDILDWLLHTVLILLGLILMAWLLLRLVPNLLVQPAAALTKRPGLAAVYGVFAVALAIPATAALIFLARLFWGWYPGAVGVLTFAFGLLSLLWLFSPLISGYWLGHLMAGAVGGSPHPLPTTLVGIGAIVVVARVIGLVPCAGELVMAGIYLSSLVCAVGGFVLHWRGDADTAME